IITMIKSNMLSLSSDAQTTDEFIGEMKEDTYFDTIYFKSQHFINQIRNQLNDIHSGGHRSRTVPIEYNMYNEDDISVSKVAEGTSSYGNRKEK
ncbi:MAG: hypothetical protein J5790_01025, partial [Bacteroidaceae bacterium]|nr:hypothetical protein [Bacteroidaceae bacterium]